MTEYDTLLMTARIKQLSLIDSQEKLLDKTLKVAYQDIDKLLANMAVGSTDTIKPARLNALKKELSAIIDNTIDNTRDFVVKGISDGVQIGTDGHTRAGMALMYDIAPDVADKIPRAFATLNMDAVNAILARTYDDNKTFSNRIWDLRNHSKTVISETVSSGVLRGESARNIAKRLQKYLLGYEELMTGIPEEDIIARKRLMRGRGDLRYNAMRLARTEINNAFREANVLSAEKAPWVEGIKWNLSASHPKIDICDTYASQDLYGMGKGIYPPQSTPRDHPNGLCFQTDKLISDKKMLDMIRSGEMAERLGMPLPKVEIVKPVIVPEKPTSQMAPKELREKILREHDTKAIEKAFDDYEKVSNEYGSLFKKYKSTRDDKVYAELQDTYDKLENARKTVEMVAKKDIKEIHDILHYDKKGFNIEAVMVGKGSGAFTKHIQGQLDEISKFINPDIVKVKKVGITQKGGRAKESRGVMSLNAKSDIATTAHEYGHVVEGMSNEVHKDTYGFFLARTSGESEISLGRLLPYRYGSGEFCKKDKFIDPYMGKTYTGRTDTEILSMGMTMLFENPLILAKRDPEYFDLIISVLRGL